MIKNISLGLILLSTLALAQPSYAANSNKGAKLYQNNCARCHGVDGQPTFPLAANFQRKEGLRVSEKSLLERIKRGKRSCPAYGGLLRDEELLDLIAFLRTFR